MCLVDTYFNSFLLDFIKIVGLIAGNALFIVNSFANK